jgi:FkbM family methyltransferase
MRVAEVSRHSFIVDGLWADAVVLDLGMNRGEFSRAVSERFGCRIIGVEPVHELFAGLPQLPRLTAEPCAVTADGMPVRVHLNRDTCATIDPRLAQSDVASVEVAATTIGELLKRHAVARVALVKLDVEGAELDILQRIESDVLARIDQLTVEFHDFLDPSQAVEVTQVMQRMDREGFACLKFSRDNTDVVFLNRARLPAGPLQRLWLAARYKYPRGIVRRLSRSVRRGRSAPPVHT